MRRADVPTIGQKAHTCRLSVWPPNARPTSWRPALRRNCLIQKVAALIRTACSIACNHAANNNQIQLPYHMNTQHIAQTKQALLHIPILFKVLVYPCRQRDNVERRLSFAVRKKRLACFVRDDGTCADLLSCVVVTVSR